MSVIFISLFHGRTDENAQLQGWGFEGPIIGPVQLSWVYGSVKVHPPDGNDFIMLPITENFLISLNKCFYGDFEILHGTDPLLLKAVLNGRRVLGYKELCKLINENKK